MGYKYGKSRWAEIVNSYTEDTASVDKDGDIVAITSIDAYKTKNANEEGRTIAKVLLSKNGDINVMYIDDKARADEYAQLIIAEAIENLGCGGNNGT